MTLLNFVFDQTLSNFIPIILMLIAGYARHKTVTICLVSLLAIVVIGGLMAPMPNTSMAVGYVIFGGLSFAIARYISARAAKSKSPSSDPG